MILTPVLIPIVAIVGAFTFVIVQAIVRARVREMEIRERIAMIEKGLIPAPESNPEGFERAMKAVALPGWDERYAGRGRGRRSGIMLVGIGLGLMLLITVAGRHPSEGLGVGGFIVVIGLAVLANSLFDRSSAAQSSQAAQSTTPPPEHPPSA